MFNAARLEYSVVNVDACITEIGQPAAWIQVENTALLTFFNENGDEAAYLLNGYIEGLSHTLGSTKLNHKVPSHYSIDHSGNR